MRAQSVLAWLACLLCAFAAPGAAQDSEGLELTRLDVPASVRAGESGEATWILRNGEARGYTVLAEAIVPADADWVVSVAPEQAVVGPGDEATFTVQITPGERPSPRTLELTLRVAAVNDTILRLSDTVQVKATAVTLILGTWDNPLPAPLDGTAGAFVLNVLAWLVISLVVMWLIDPTLRALTRRTRTEVDDHIIRILRVPVFAVLFTFGIKQSLEVFPLPGWAFRSLDRVWLIVLVLAILYVGYRVWQEIVLLIGRRIAARTESKLDDRLLPVFEKLGGIVIIVVGIFYVISSFGVDLTVFAAGGVLGAMVIAFAAQDTLSNFFSGVHLLVDQPFQEGDDIMLDTGEVTTVTKIGLRSTHLYHVANHETIIVPNNMLATNRIINLLRPDQRYKVRVDIGVAYGTDVQKVKQILLDIARSHPLVLRDAEHQPFVRFQNFGASSLDFSVHAWIDDVYTRFAVASDLRELIDQRFAAEGIEIPFPQHVLWYGRDEKERADQGKTGGGAVNVHRSRTDARREQATSAETGSGDAGGEAEV